MSLVPTLETPRLILRGHRLADLDDSVAMWADAEMTRFISGAPAPRDETWARVLRYAGHWTLLGFGYWMLEEKETGRFVGEAGFGDWKRPVEPSIAGLPEHGWAIATWAQGKGFASEAVTHSLAWARVQFPGVAPVCMIDPGNTASERVAAKAGYKPYADSSFRGRPTVLYRWTET
jgi:RimJ/RimL family protein N-acetyltransferase